MIHVPPTLLKLVVTTNKMERAAIALGEGRRGVLDLIDPYFVRGIDNEILLSASMGLIWRPRAFSPAVRHFQFPLLTFSMAEGIAVAHIFSVGRIAEESWQATDMLVAHPMRDLRDIMAEWSLARDHFGFESARPALSPRLEEFVHTLLLLQIVSEFYGLSWTLRPVGATVAGSIDFRIARSRDTSFREGASTRFRWDDTYADMQVLRPPGDELGAIWEHGFGPLWQNLLPPVGDQRAQVMAYLGSLGVNPWVMGTIPS